MSDIQGQLDRQVQQQIDRRLDRAVYKGGRLLGNEITLTFEKDGKTFDLRIIASACGLDTEGIPTMVTPLLSERAL